MNLLAIYEDYQHNLQDIELELISALQTNQQVLHAASLHPLNAGGKRLRPLFALLAGRFGHYNLEKLHKLAVSLELIHMATLVHDDVIDNSNTRRGHPTVKAKWDNQVAMITGNFIFSKALETVTKLKEPIIHQLLSKAILHMVKGELYQLSDFFKKDITVRRYLHRVKRKTALLFAISCQLGAIVSEAEPQIIRTMYLYGYGIGMAFQLTDDVLDFVGDEGILGKPIGSDLRQGNVTLPVIYAMAEASTNDKEKLLQYLDSGGKSGSLAEMILIVKKTGGIKNTLSLANQYLDKATGILHQLPESKARESLRAIAQFLATRSY